MIYKREIIYLPADEVIYCDLRVEITENLFLLLRQVPEC